MAKPFNFVSFLIPDEKGINVKTYGANVRSNPSVAELDYGSQLYDKTFGTIYSDAQTNAMKERGLDEYDMVFIDGKSVREQLGGKHAEDPEKAARVMQSMVIGALTDANKKVEYCNVEKDGDKLNITPPTAVKADLRLKEEKPKLGFFGAIRNFFNRRMDSEKTNAEKAKTLYEDEKSTARDERHKKMTSGLKTRVSMQDANKLCKDAVDKSNASFKHNLALIDSIEVVGDDGKKKPLSPTELKEAHAKATANFFDTIRPNDRMGMFNLYMLHNNMTLDEIVSTDSKYVQRKKELSNEFFGKLMAASDEVDAAKDAKVNETLKSFDKNLDREKFKKDYTAEYPKKFENMTPEDTEKTIDEAIKDSRALAVGTASKKAEIEVKTKSQNVRELRNLFVAMGDTCVKQKFPVNSVSDIKDVAKNYSQMYALNMIAHDYDSNFQKFDPEFANGPDAKRLKTATSVVNRFMFAPLTYANYVASDAFFDASKGDPSQLTMLIGWASTIPEIDKTMQGKNSFSEVDVSCVKKLDKIQIESVNKATDTVLTDSYAPKNPEQMTKDFAELALRNSEQKKNIDIFDEVKSQQPSKTDSLAPKTKEQNAKAPVNEQLNMAVKQTGVKKK